MENDNNTDFEQSNFEDTAGNTDESSTIDYKELYEQERRKANKLKNKLYSKDSDITKPINNSSDAEWKEKMELKVDGYTDEEANFILKNGGKQSLSSSPYIKSAIDSLRDQKKAENAILGDEGQKSSSHTGLSAEAFSKLSADEQLKKLSELK